MIPFIASLLALTVGTGIWLLIAGTRPAPDTAPRRRRSLTRNQRRQLLILAAATAAGIVLWLITGYFVAVVALPVIAWLIPHLVPRSASVPTITRLNAMEEWTRSLTGVLGAGAGIEQAIIASRSSAPAALSSEVGMLAARLQAGIPIERALESFGDDLDDPTGDILTGSLILGARRRGTGLARLLDGTAETISEDVAARRLIEADRSKPRSNARIIAIIAIVVLLGEFIFNPTYVEPYRTPIGQLLLAALGGLFLASLWWMNAATREPKSQRLLHTGGTR